MSDMIGFIVPEPLLAEIRRDSLGRLFHLTALGRFSRAGDHFISRPEPLDQHILIVCVEGSGHYVIDGERREVHAPDWVVLPAGIAHEYGSSTTNPWTIYWVHFAGTTAREHALRLNTLQWNRRFSRSHVERVFDEMWKSVASGWGGGAFSYANHLLWGFVGGLTCASSLAVGDDDGFASSVGSRALAFMKRHLDTPISLKDLAMDVGLSVSRFSTRFKAEMQTAPIDCLIQLRMREAMRLLDESDLRISEIGRLVCFDDPSHFTKTFKKFVGCSPREYRAKEKG